MSSGRLFQSFGPAEANERSPTVTRRDGRASSWLGVADRRRRSITTIIINSPYLGVKQRNVQGFLYENH